jgi:hypothetical protein
VSVVRLLGFIQRRTRARRPQRDGAAGDPGGARRTPTARVLDAPHGSPLDIHQR